MVEVDGFNLFLIIVTVVMAFVIAATTIYLLVAFQHPEDRMQAWFPKLVVSFSLFIAIVTVLFFPLDVANRRACDKGLLFSDCDLTLPMESMWYAVYIINIVLVYIVTPFTIFYYEADSDYTLWQRIKSALIWTFGASIVFIIIFIIIYLVAGSIEYDTMALSSGVVDMAQIGDISSECIGAADNTITGNLCSAFLGPEKPMVVWNVRASYTIYIISCASIMGWILFMVMGGVGLVALPYDMIMTWFARPQKTISKSEYMELARNLANRAKDYRDVANTLKKEEMATGRSRAWRKNYKQLNTDLNLLEDEHRDLESRFPQGEDRDTKWVLYVLSFWFSLVGGIVFAIVALTWILHICIYVLPSTPLHPFLNAFFTSLDNAFPLFGTAFFSVWCFFLILACIKGFTKLGLNFVFITLYPMKLGATMMSSFLVNSALILLASTAVVQFCATSFEAYANETAIQEIFGNQLYQLANVRHIFASNIFIYIMLGFAVLSAAWITCCGSAAQKRKKKTLEEVYAQS